jgi:hypothetical protein
MIQRIIFIIVIVVIISEIGHLFGKAFSLDERWCNNFLSKAVTQFWGHAKITTYHEKRDPSIIGHSMPMDFNGEK